MNDPNHHRKAQKATPTQADDSLRSFFDLFSDSLVPPHYQDLDERAALEPTPLREDAVNHFITSRTRKSSDRGSIVSSQMHSSAAVLPQHQSLGFSQEGGLVESNNSSLPAAGKIQNSYNESASPSITRDHLLINMYTPSPQQMGFPQLQPSMFQYVGTASDVATNAQQVVPSSSTGAARQIQQIQNIDHESQQTHIPSTLNGPGDLWSTRASSLLGNLVCSGERGSKKSREKPKRPLSAYNIFFKEERLRLMSQDSTKSTTTITEDQKTASGKIKFENLAKIISSNWQKLEESDKTYYKDQAATDFQRYKAEMEVYEQKLQAQQNQTMTPKEAPY